MPRLVTWHNSTSNCRSQCQHSITMYGQYSCSCGSQTTTMVTRTSAHCSLRVVAVVPCCKVGASAEWFSMTHGAAAVGSLLTIAVVGEVIQRRRCTIQAVFVAQVGGQRVVCQIREFARWSGVVRSRGLVSFPAILPPSRLFAVGVPPPCRP